MALELDLRKPAAERCADPWKDAGNNAAKVLGFMLIAPLFAGIAGPGAFVVFLLASVIACPILLCIVIVCAVRNLIVEGLK